MTVDLPRTSNPRLRNGIFFHENKMSVHNFTNFCFFLFQVHITIYCAATSANHGSYIPTYSKIPKGRMETFGGKGQT